LIKQNKNSNLINNDEKNEIINTMDNNKDEIYDNEYFYINLFSIILNDYVNFQNINHIETIENIEIYIILSFHDYNEIKLNYEINENNINSNEIEIFGENFVINNKENCFLIINEKIMDLNRFINLNDISDNIFTKWPIQLNISLIERKYKLMTDLSYMFENVQTLTSKSNIGDYNSYNIKSMKYMFNNCNLLKELPDISNMNNENVSDMSFMFNNCSSLLNLPDISKWNTEKVKDISYMFHNCESLTSLPDISKWNTNNIEKMEKIFSNCKSLLNLPNISKWNIREGIENHNILEGCQLLEENLQNANYNYKKLMKCSNYIFCIFKNICFCFSYSLFLSSLIVLFLFHFSPFYYSFQLDTINAIISKPIEKLNLMNHTDIIYITELLKINNETKINEINNNKESFINDFLNFTKLNNNVTFESSKKIFKIINIMHGVVCLIKFIILLLIFIKNKFEFLESNTIFFLVLFILLNFFSLTLGIINIFYLNKIKDSLTNFSENIIKFFRIKIPELIENKIDDLKDSLVINIWIIIISIIFIGVFASILKNILKEKISLKTFQDYLKRRIN